VAHPKISYTLIALAFLILAAITFKNSYDQSKYVVGSVERVKLIDADVKAGKSFEDVIAQAASNSVVVNKNGGDTLTNASSYVISFSVPESEPCADIAYLLTKSFDHVKVNGLPITSRVSAVTTCDVERDKLIQVTSEFGKKN
jgi:hypothetical protein